LKRCILIGAAKRGLGDNFLNYVLTITSVQTLYDLLCDTPLCEVSCNC